MGVKFQRVSNNSTRYLFGCPGCESGHFIDTNPNESPCWIFNGDVEKPTVSPSIRISGTADISDDEHQRIMAGEKIEPKPFVCHFFIKEGFYEYCGDSTHKLSGQKIEVPDWESF